MKWGEGVLYSGAELTGERVFSATDETQGVTVTDDLACRSSQWVFQSCS